MLVSNTILQNRYRVIRELGHGGMGTVYEALDQRVNCIVALKETLAAFDGETRSAFEREAALLANLRHQALPKVMDYFTEGDGDFLVMEFIPGQDLGELLKLGSSQFSQAQVMRWADEVLKILEYLHGQQPPILHRDIKPANLKLTKQEEIFLLDFGLAKGAAGQMQTLTTNRSVRGFTPLYASLEQIHGHGTDPRSDLYSLGATFYHILTGVPPTDAPARFDALEDDKPDPLQPIETLNPKCSAGVAAIIYQAMALRRKERPVSAGEMRKALRRAAGEDERRNAEDENTLSRKQAAAEEAATSRAQVEARLKDEESHLQAEEEGRSKAEAEAQRRAEEIRVGLEEEARRRAEFEARLKEDEARLQAEQEVRVRAEAEAQRRAEEIRVGLEEEARRRAEFEARLKEDEARLQAEQEARVRAEAEARRRAEEIRVGLEEEARRRAEFEARLKEDEARLQAEQEARAKAEGEARQLAEDARMKAEEEAVRRAEVEALVKEQEARLQAEQEARIQVEAEAFRLAEEARAQAEEEARRRVEVEARLKEEEARLQSEREAREQPEAEEAARPSIEGEARYISQLESLMSAARIRQRRKEAEIAGEEEEQAGRHVDFEKKMPAEIEALTEGGKGNDVVSKGREIVWADDINEIASNVLERLSSPEASERSAALAEVARVGGDHAFRCISRAFDDKSEDVRNAAARALFDVHPDHAAIFTKALREGTPERRRLIGRALAGSGLAIEAVANLTGEDREKTYDAFSLLFLMSKTGEIQPLLEVIEDHLNVGLRIAVVKLLALSGQPEIIPAFRRLAVRGSIPGEVRSSIMEAIYMVSSQARSDAD